MFEKDTSDALDVLIDLDEEVKLGRLKHVYRDLVTIWSYLVRLAVASRIWGELVHSIKNEYPETTITIIGSGKLLLVFDKFPNPQSIKAFAISHHS
jgi:hypothetical protein